MVLRGFSKSTKGVAFKAKILETFRFVESQVISWIVKKKRGL